jgi:hypothetical protein
MIEAAFEPGRFERSFPGAALPAWLERRRLVSRGDLGRAHNRQRIYGGGLDTALLELGLCDEATLSRALEDASGLPAPPREWLEKTGRAAGRFIDLATARRLCAHPVADNDVWFEVIVGPEVDLDAVEAWAASEHDRTCRFYVAPEVHFEALVARIHQTPLPSRFLRLLARYEERQRVRGGATDGLAAITATARALARRARVVPLPPVETGPTVVLPPPEPVIDVVEDLSGTGITAPNAAVVVPRTGATAPAVEITGLLDPDDDPTAVPSTYQLAAARTLAAAGGPDAVKAIAQLANMRDVESVPELIDLLQSDDEALVEAAARALGVLTAQDFGTSRWRWTFWHRTWGKKHRVEWLLDALSAPDPERRLQAAQELERITGHYVGYHFDLGRRDREAARRRWERWWEETGRGRLGRS